MTSFSVLVPCYNEEKRLPVSWIKLERFLRCYPGSEIIFIDDGSNDSTKALLCEIERLNNNVKVLSLFANCGKWAAIRTGMLYAKKQYCIISDADYSVDIPDELYFLILDGKTVFIGDRYSGNNNIPIRRYIPSRVFNFLTRIITGVNVPDSQAPYKVFPNNRVIKDVFLDMEENRFAGDVEFLYLCKKKNVPIKSVIVDYDFVAGSTVSVRKHSVEMLSTLFRIRRRKYD